MVFRVRTKKAFFLLFLLAIAFFAYVVMQFFSNKNYTATPAVVLYPFFWLIFGCGACILIVCFSNWLAQLGLTKEENDDVQ